MSDNPYLHKGDEWYFGWLNPDMEIVPNAKDTEIERLRAQVESLAGAIAQIERAAAGSIYSQEGIHAIASDALKSLEVKP